MSSPTRLATIAEVNDMANAIMEELHHVQIAVDERFTVIEARLANVEGALFVIGQVLRKVYPDEFGEVEGSGA